MPALTDEKGIPCVLFGRGDILIVPIKGGGLHGVTLYSMDTPMPANVPLDPLKEGATDEDVCMCGHKMLLRLVGQKSGDLDALIAVLGSISIDYLRRAITAANSKPSPALLPEATCKASLQVQPRQHQSIIGIDHASGPELTEVYVLRDGCAVPIEDGDHRDAYIAELEAQVATLTRRLAEVEAELTGTKDMLACSTCFYRPTHQHPCRYASECCYSTGVGHTEGKNCWESNTPLELLTGEEENGAD